MATWQEKFSELSTENQQQVERWIDGGRDHAGLRASSEALAFFTTQYEAAGEPDRDTEMLTV